MALKLRRVIRDEVNCQFSLVYDQTDTDVDGSGDPTIDLSKDETIDITGYVKRYNFLTVGATFIREAGATGTPQLAVNGDAQHRPNNKDADYTNSFDCWITSTNGATDESPQGEFGAAEGILIFSPMDVDNMRELMGFSDIKFIWRMLNKIRVQLIGNGSSNGKLSEFALHFFYSDNNLPPAPALDPAT